MTNQDSQWVNIQTASEIIGRSENAVRLLVKRGKFDQLRKIKDKGRGHWVIHRDSIARLVNLGQLVEVDGSDQLNQDHSIPLKHYEEQRKLWLSERDQLKSGLMMYRYKFEEIEQKMRLLPAPPEMVARELEEKAAALAQAEKIVEEAKETQKHYIAAVEQLRAKLQEEEYAREAYRLQWEAAQAELKRPWWKKIFGKK
jgi:hypothetical protein